MEFVRLPDRVLIGGKDVIPASSADVFADDDISCGIVVFSIRQNNTNGTRKRETGILRCVRISQGIDERLNQGCCRFAVELKANGVLIDVRDRLDLLTGDN